MARPTRKCWRFLSGSGETDSDAMVRKTFAEILPADDFDNDFRHVLHDGLLLGTEFEAFLPAMQPPPSITPPAESSGFEARFLQDLSMYDGRFAGNGWLQEMPDPLTKVGLGQRRSDLQERRRRTWRSPPATWSRSPSAAIHSKSPPTSCRASRSASSACRSDMAAPPRAISAPPSASTPTRSARLRRPYFATGVQIAKTGDTYRPDHHAEPSPDGQDRHAKAATNAWAKTNTRIQNSFAKARSRSTRTTKASFNPQGRRRHRACSFSIRRGRQF